MHLEDNRAGHPGIFRIFELFEYYIDMLVRVYASSSKLLILSVAITPWGVPYPTMVPGSCQLWQLRYYLGKIRADIIMSTFYSEIESRYREVPKLLGLRPELFRILNFERLYGHASCQLQGLFM